MSAGNDPHFIESGIGARLRQAREQAGLSIAEVGQSLKMPVRVVESLEAEDWSRLGAPVFIRGQLRSYARLLRLPVDLVLPMPEALPVAATELKPRSYTPKMQVIAEQVARRAVYIVITAAILVPVWVATRTPAVDVVQSSAPLDTSVRATSGERSVAAVTSAQPSPMRASLAPLPPRPPALSLRFEGDSWVEIVGPDGALIESGLLKAGERRTYDQGEVQRVKLGNASAVRVEHEGHVQDLAPYLRANVARFTVSSDGSLTPPAQ